MKKLYILAAALIISTFSFAQTTELYFSMFGEGSSNNKFIEIYNNTGEEVDLAPYTINLYANGNSTANNTLDLTGTIQQGDVYVIVHSSSDDLIKANSDIESAVTIYNGDDTIELSKNGSSIDLIGIIGTDPGSGWNVAGISNATKDHTLIRKTSVTGPNTNWSTSAGTTTVDSEWVVYDNNSNWDTIGSYDADSESDPNLLNKALENAQVSLYPNPAINTLTFKSSLTSIGTFEIFNTNGQLLMNEKGNISNKTLNVSSLSKGMYILKVSRDNNTQSFKFTK